MHKTTTVSKSGAADLVVVCVKTKLDAVWNKHMKNEGTLVHRWQRCSNCLDALRNLRPIAQNWMVLLEV